MSVSDIDNSIPTDNNRGRIGIKSISDINKSIPNNDGKGEVDSIPTTDKVGTDKVKYRDINRAKYNNATKRVNNVNRKAPLPVDEDNTINIDKDKKDIQLQNEVDDFIENFTYFNNNVYVYIIFILLIILFIFLININKIPII